MSDRHRLKPTNFRPEPAELDAAKKALGDRDMEGFLRACLRWLDQDPRAAIRALEPHWPEPRPRGRPRKDPDVGGGHPTAAGSR